MQFQVPQFIDVEDKIIGPFTLKQFLYLLGGVGLGYISQRFITFLGLGYIIGIGFIGLGWALAYYRPNKKPFADMVESAFNYFKNTRLYVWKRRERPNQETHLDLGNFQTTTSVSAFSKLPSSTNKLNDLTWSIDVVEKEAVEEQKPRSNSLAV